MNTPPSGSPRDLPAYFAKEHGYRDTLIAAFHPVFDAGFRFPLLLTEAAWSAAVKWTRKDEFQDEDSRIWDLLTMCRRNLKEPGSDPWEFVMVCIPNTTPQGTPSRAQLPQRLVLKNTWNTYESTGAPCLIISLPDEA